MKHLEETALQHAEETLHQLGIIEMEGILTGEALEEIPIEQSDGRGRHPCRELLQLGTGIAEVLQHIEANDRVELRGREMRFLGRVDELVKIRGELVDVFALEQALRDRVSAGLVALFADPNDRAGHVLRLRAENAEALAQAREALDLFPPYARPAVFEIGPINTTSLGKVIRQA